MVDELATYDKLVEKSLRAVDWASNKLLEFDKEFSKDVDLGWMVGFTVSLRRKGIFMVTFNVFCTRPEVVKDKATLSRICRTIGCGKLDKAQTRGGFTKLVGYCEGTRVNVYTHFCFERNHVKVVRKGEPTKAVTMCVSKAEALKLAKENGFVIEG